MASKMVEKGRALARLGVEHEQLAAACQNLARACGVTIEPREAAERLEAQEARELIGFSRRLTERPKVLGDPPPAPVSTFQDREAAKVFADGLRSMAVPRFLEADHERLIAYVTETGRVPSQHEQKLLDHGSPGTLEELAPALEQARAKADAGTWRAGDHVRYFNVGAFDESDLARIEELVEKAVDEPELFNERRAEAMRNRKMQELLARVKKPPAKPRLEAPGTVVLPTEVFGFLDQPAPVLELPHVGLLWYLVGCFENGRALPPGSRFEGEGDERALVLAARGGLCGALDPDSCFGSWQRYLRHLGVNDFIVFDQSTPEWRIQKGRRLLDLDRATAAS